MRFFPGIRIAALGSVVFGVMPVTRAYGDDVTEPSPQVRTLLLLPVSAPNGIKLSPLTRAMELYAQDFPVTVESAPTAMNDDRAQAIARAKLRGSEMVIFANWQQQDADSWKLVITVVSATSGQVLDSSEVPYPDDPDAAFYRFVGLRLRTLLRVASTKKAAEPKPPPVTPPEPPPPSGPSERARERSGILLEGAFATLFPVSTGKLVLGLAAGLLWEQEGQWAIGLGGLRDFGQSGEGAFGTSETVTTRMTISGRYRLWSFAPKTSLWFRLDGGAAHVSTDATLRTTGETTSVANLIPLGLTGIGGRFKVGDTVGGTLQVVSEWYPTYASRTIMGEKVFSTGHVRVGIELGLQFFP